MHTWFAVKPTNAKSWTVYEVIGWRLRWAESVVVVRTREPDGRWFGAQPELYAEKRGEGVDELIKRIDKAAREYPYANEYTVWPGPNSNTFTAWIARAVPELGVDPGDRHRRGASGARSSPRHQQPAAAGSRYGGFSGSPRRERALEPAFRPQHRPGARGEASARRRIQPTLVQNAKPSQRTPPRHTPRPAAQAALTSAPTRPSPALRAICSTRSLCREGARETRHRWTSAKSCACPHRRGPCPKASPSPCASLYSDVKATLTPRGRGLRLVTGTRAVRVRKPSNSPTISSGCIEARKLKLFWPPALGRWIASPSFSPE